MSNRDNIDYLGDFFLEVAKGNVPNHSHVDKFGRAPSGVQTTNTDIWDRADATPTQQVWTAPTTARVHSIVSTSDNDGKTGSPSSTGARTLRIRGLTSWDTLETTEDVTLTGTDAVNTSKSYVIIHHMEVLTKGATSANVGTITATAATDATVTAAILPGNGQTLMAIHGVPRGTTAYIGRISASIEKTGGASSAVDITLLCNPEPDVELINFITKHNFSIAKDGTSAYTLSFLSPKALPGPCIIKMHGIASAADQDVSAAFDLTLVDD
jgi:hypothetical protein